MRGKKLKRILGTSWESLFNEILNKCWGDGQTVEEIVLSEKASFPIVPLGFKKNKRVVHVYASDFGTHKLKVDRRLKGDQMFFFGVDT